MRAFSFIFLYKKSLYSVNTLTLYVYVFYVSSEERYDNMIKICEACGKEFETKNARQKYCKGVHYRTCAVCGKQFEVSLYQLTAKDGRTTCSKECAAEMRKSTNLDKYGGSAPASSAEVRAKMTATTLNRYGVEHAMQSSDIQEKAKATNREKYGCDWYSLTDEMRKKLADKWADDEYKQQVRESIANSNLEKYGAECIFAVPEIREKIHDKYEAKTGYREPFANPEVRKKSEATLLEHYGVKNPLQNKSICQAAIETRTRNRKSAEVETTSAEDNHND